MFSATTLLIEDNEALANTYGALFNDEGLQLDLATDWDAGLAKFRVVGHSLVIADYNLPGPRHGLQLLFAMKRLVPSSQMVLISGAMSAKAQKLAADIPFIDAFYVKGPDCGDQLLNLARVEDERALRPTDWRRVAEGYLRDPGVANPLLERVDDELRADVARRKGARG